MTTSDTTKFNLNIEDIINEAYERCGLESRSGYDLKTARRSMNIMFAEWANRGINLWVVEERSKTLTADAAEYTLGDDVVDIMEAAITKSSKDYRIERISRAEYLSFTDKTSTGRPTQMYLQKSVTPKVFFYPAPDSTSTYTFKFQALTRIQDAGDDYTNKPEVPFRFLPCLISGLAYYIAMKFAPEKLPILKQIYDEEWMRAAAEDRDSVSLKLVPGVN